MLCTSSGTWPSVYVNKHHSRITWWRLPAKRLNSVGTRNLLIIKQLSKLSLITNHNCILFIILEQWIKHITITREKFFSRRFFNIIFEGKGPLSYHTCGGIGYRFCDLFEKISDLIAWYDKKWFLNHFPMYGAVYLIGHCIYTCILHVRTSYKNILIQTNTSQFIVLHTSWQTCNINMYNVRYFSEIDKNMVMNWDIASDFLHSRKLKLQMVSFKD